MAHPVERLPESLQEGMLTVLALDARYGPVVAGQVLPEHFDGQLHDAAAAVLAYHRQYRKPPGEAQLVAVIAAGREGDRAANARRLAGRLVAQAVTINAAYMASRAGEFVRRQTLLAAVGTATDRFLAGTEEGLLEDVEGILRGALSARRTPMDAGTFLSDSVRGLQFLEKRDEGYKLGIKPLDDGGIALRPKELLLYVAPKNSGKSWFAVHCGTRALHQGAKVVHITLEMEDSQVVGRYYQSLWAAGWTSDIPRVAEFTMDEFGNASSFQTESVKPEMVWTSKKARKWLRERMEHWGTRLGRLVVREFPSGTLTIQTLEGYLDYLEAEHGFVPHVLIVDYPDLMSVPLRDFRLGLGRLYVDLRGLAQRRNLAVIAPTQGNRTSLRAANVHADMATEDISKVFTADTVLSYSQTEGEERLGLARLQVNYVRSATRGMIVMLAQSYGIGQYARQAVLMRSGLYWDRVRELGGGTGKSGDGDEDDDGLQRRRK